jgi:hypothetical protein
LHLANGRFNHIERPAGGGRRRRLALSGEEKPRRRENQVDRVITLHR